MAMNMFLWINKNNYRDFCHKFIHERGVISVMNSYMSVAQRRFVWDLKTTEKKIKTCFQMVTCWPVAPASIYSGEPQNLCFTDYKKCRSTLLIRIWILAFCLCNALFLLLFSVEPILPLTLVVALHSSLPGIARYRRPGDYMKFSLFLFSIFCLP